VYAGLADVPDECRIVVVHDAARPFIDDDTIPRVVAAARDGYGAVAALPMVDTLKEADADGRVTRTVDRSRLWRAQTPQAFPRAMLIDAYRAARAERIAATDCAALCERLGMPVRLVSGSERAMKITTPDDFARAEALAPIP
jgi:2-C-methyl-D-erythritol 4-phosphate cytidylyltransferase